MYHSVGHSSIRLLKPEGHHPSACPGQGTSIQAYTPEQQEQRTTCTYWKLRITHHNNVIIHVHIRVPQSRSRGPQIPTWLYTFKRLSSQISYETFRRDQVVYYHHHTSVST